MLEPFVQSSFELNKAMIVQVRVSVNRFNSRNSERLKIVP